MALFQTEKPKPKVEERIDEIPTPSPQKTISRKEIIIEFKRRLRRLYDLEVL